MGRFGYSESIMGKGLYRLVSKDRIEARTHVEDPASEIRDMVRLMEMPAGSAVAEVEGKTQGKFALLEKRLLSEKLEKGSQWTSDALILLKLKPDSAALNRLELLTAMIADETLDWTLRTNALNGLIKKFEAGVPATNLPKIKEHLKAMSDDTEISTYFFERLSQSEFGIEGLRSNNGALLNWMRKEWVPHLSLDLRRLNWASQIAIAKIMNWGPKDLLRTLDLARTLPEKRIPPARPSLGPVPPPTCVKSRCSSIGAARRCPPSRPARCRRD